MFQSQDVKDLLKQSTDPILSLYLCVDPSLPDNQAANPKWRTWAKKSLRDLSKRVSPEQSAAWEDIYSRVESYLDAYMPTSRGLALLYGTEYERVFELPAVLENQVTFGTPLIAPLLWVMEEYEPYLIVVVDHAEARFLTTYLGQIGFRDVIELKIDTREWHRKMNAVSVTGSGRGSAGDEFQDRVEAHMSRHWREVADRIGQLMKEHHARRVILAGDEQAAHAVERRLPAAIRQGVVGVKALPMRSTPHEVLQHILPMALDYEYQQEIMLVEQTINTAKGSGRACIGREAVFHALDQRRIELLLAPWPMADENLAQELPFQVFAAGGTVELIHGPAAARLMAEGELVARLYYTPSANL